MSKQMKRYRLDIEKSDITWTGFQPAKAMLGKVYFNAGLVCIDHGRVTEGGQFIIDMNSIETVDKKLDNENKIKLSNHLKSGDFFNAAMYPSAVVKITHIKEVNPSRLEEDTLRTINPTHDVTATLTIKNTTHEIKFPAKILLSDNHIKMDVKLFIDRSQWGIDFMLDESYGEEKIKQLLAVEVKISAEVMDEVDAEALNKNLFQIIY